MGRRVLSSCLLLVASATLLAADDPTGVLRKHSVWLQKGLNWEHTEVDSTPNETFAGATVLYFGADGRFGMFGGLVIRHGNKMQLSKGDGGTVYSGRWTASNGAIQVSYRLVDAYKVAIRKGSEPLKVPGPMRVGSIRIEVLKDGTNQASPEAQLDGARYEATQAFDDSEFRERLDIFDKKSDGNVKGQHAKH